MSKGAEQSWFLSLGGRRAPRIARYGHDKAFAWWFGGSKGVVHEGRIQWIFRADGRTDRMITSEMRESPPLSLSWQPQPIADRLRLADSIR
jgi:hypothetical protein